MSGDAQTNRPALGGIVAVGLSSDRSRMELVIRVGDENQIYTLTEADANLLRLGLNKLIGC